jgi:adenosylmethionine-8-amino-7-oxononanoate aminotransferase
MANLDIMEDENLVENSAEMGTYMYGQLQTLNEHQIVGDVRGGKGLLCAVELVKDRDTKESFPKEAELDAKALKLMNEHRLLGRAGNVISFAPPLSITKNEVDWVVKQVDEIITDLEKQLL